MKLPNGSVIIPAMAKEVAVSEWYTDVLRRDQEGNPKEFPVAVEVLNFPGVVDSRAAEIFADRVRNKPNLVVSLATGGSPRGMYNILAGMAERREVDFKEITAFHLDEYVGLDPDHPQSYNRYVREHILDPLGVPSANRHLIDGRTDPHVMAMI